MEPENKNIKWNLCKKKEAGEEDEEERKLKVQLSQKSQGCIGCLCVNRGFKISGKKWRNLFKELPRYGHLWEKTHPRTTMMCACVCVHMQI